MNFDWVIPATGDEVGNNLGYATANAELRSALKRVGAREDRDARVAVHFMFPKVYEPRPGRRNVLFAMFENWDPAYLTGIYAPAFRRCDLIVTPSQWCAEMFSHFTDTPIRVCPLGVDPALFPYRRRKWRPEQGEPFVWLYVGAPNRRKWTILPDIYRGFLAGFPAGAVHLLIKTTGVAHEKAFLRMLTEGAIGGDVEVVEFPEGKVYFGTDVTVDTRMLRREELAEEIYHRAHGMLFLHCGEGWGITGLEALSTGLPLVVSDHSGTQEYADRETAFPVRCETRMIEFERNAVSEGGDSYVGPWPLDTDAVDQMGRVMRDYHRACVVAKRGSERARSFTWDASALRLLALLREVA